VKLGEGRELPVQDTTVVALVVDGSVQILALPTVNVLVGVELTVTCTLVIGEEHTGTPEFAT